MGTVTLRRTACFNLVIDLRSSSFFQSPVRKIWLYFKKWEKFYKYKGNHDQSDLHDSTFSIIALDTF